MTKTLNENQQEAVAWGKGPLLVLAGPGSGKTFVLTKRIARLIKESPEARFRVLGLTFTTKAADEMRERVGNLLDRNVRRAHLTTFHAFCAEVLRQHGSHLGLRPNFEILSQEPDRLKVIESARHEVGTLNIPNTDSRGIIKLIDYLQREGYDSNTDIPLPLQNSGADWIREIYDAYIKLMLRNNYLDFGSLLVCCLRLFREYPRIAKHYRIVYPYICIDEYQDTNKCQEKILHFICPPNSRDDVNLFVVADDDQTIYQWNGASPERLQNIRKYYDMQVIQLPESYRCPSEIIDLANKLIMHNDERLTDKTPLRSASVLNESTVRFPTNKIRIISFSDHSEEMAWIAKDIRDLKIPANECAILARNKKLLKVAANALQDEGLQPYFVQHKNEFEFPLVRFVHSALRLANAPQNYAWLNNLCEAFCELTGVNVNADNAEAKSSANGDSLLRGFLGTVQRDPALSLDSLYLLNVLRDRLMERLDYEEFCKKIFIWFEDQLEDTDASDRDNPDKEEMNIWKEIEKKIKKQSDTKSTLSQFLQELDMRPKMPAIKQNEIPCFTIHLAKGKEFKHVYLVGLAEDQLPSYHAIRKGDISHAMEEERRNCFVAITRTQESLTLTYSHTYFGWPKQSSRFLQEMGLEAAK